MWVLCCNRRRRQFDHTKTISHQRIFGSQGEIRPTDLIRFMFEAFAGSSCPCVQIMPSLEMVFVSPSGSGAQLGVERTEVIRTGSGTLGDGRLLFFLI